MLAVSRHHLCFICIKYCSCEKLLLIKEKWRQFMLSIEWQMDYSQCCINHTRNNCSLFRNHLNGVLTACRPFFIHKKYSCFDPKILLLEYLCVMKMSCKRHFCVKFSWYKSWSFDEWLHLPYHAIMLHVQIFVAIFRFKQYTKNV